MKRLSLLLAGVFCLTASVLSAAVTVKETAKGVMLENDYVKLEIIRQGGKIASLFNKKSNLDLLAGDSGVYAGLGKVREIMGQSLGVMVGSRNITVKKATADVVEVETSYTCRNGLIGGLEIIKTYTLRKDSPAVEFSELYRSREKNNRFAMNWHHRFPPRDTANVKFFSGSAVKSLPKAAQSRNNFLLKVESDYVGWLNSKDKNGVILFLNEKRALEYLYFWADSDDYTLESYFREVSLRPVVGADEWIISGSIVPFIADGTVVAANRNAIVTVDKTKTAGKVWLLRDLGKGEIKVGGKSVAADLKVNASQSITLSKNAEKVVIATGNAESTLNIPAAADRGKELVTQRKAPVKKIAGVNGFYYFYPALWLSPEIDAAVMFGLRGDFKKVKNFRMALLLPEGVKVSFARVQVTDCGTTTVNGKTYRRFEMPSSRKVSYAGAMHVDIAMDKNFKGGEGYVMAVWDGGAQNPEKFDIKVTPKLPELGKGFKHFRVAMGVTSQLSSKWQVPYFNKIGVNMLEYWEYLPKVMFVDKHPDGVFNEYIKTAADRNMISVLELASAFARPGDATKGHMVKELGTLHYPKKSFERIKADEIKAVDYHGKKVNLVCPSLRNRYYTKALDSVRVAVDYGFERVMYDEEAWSSGSSICFCERCKAQFKEFLQKRYPNVPYQDPAITAQNPGKYKELEDAWWDFKTDLVADLYQGIRNVFDSHKNPSGKSREMGVWLSSSVGSGSVKSRYGAIADRLTDYVKFGKIFDWIAPMMYTDNSSVIYGNAIAANKLLKGTRAKLMMGLCPNRYYEYFRVEAQSFGSEDVILEQTLETFFAGAKGVIYWSHRGGFRGAKDFRNVALAVKMLMPVEDILYKGEVAELKHNNPAVNVTTWKLGKEYAVFVRNYDSGKVRTTLEIPAGMKVYDTLTGKEVSATVELDALRVKVLKIK